MFDWLKKEHIVAEDGFNRWKVPPASIAIHLCIGMAYGFSVFWLPLSKALATAGTGAQACARDHSKVLSTEDVLCRVPRGGLAFVSLANGAYDVLGINWALRLLPILAAQGHQVGAE